jgi:hypothetical protein
MTTLSDLVEANASRLYKTAQARIACAKFPAGAFVAVKFSHRTDNGVTWYEIGKTQYGTLDQPVVYPAHHLTNFTL